MSGVAAGQRQADGCCVGGFQLCGSSSSIREAGCVCTRSSTSARYSTGLTPQASHVATSEYTPARFAVVISLRSTWTSTSVLDPERLDADVALRTRWVRADGWLKPRASRERARTRPGLLICCCRRTASPKEEGVQRPKILATWRGHLGEPEPLAFGLRADSLLLRSHCQRKRPCPQSRFPWTSRPLSQRALEDLNLWPSDS